jgi:MoaA/NifB/PqqE/SkfB family radical SAM enzyme
MRRPLITPTPPSKTTWTRPANDRRAAATFEALGRCKARWGRRLWKNANTVITADNAAELPALAAHVWENFGCDGHYFNVIRGDPKDPGQKAVPAAELRRLHRLIADYEARYAARMFDDRHRLVRWFKRAAYAGTLAFHHRTQAANHPGPGDGWPMPCTAGETILVIDHDGGVRACELRDRIGNLRDHGCDFAAMWADRARTDEVAAIAADRCFCSHVCFIHDSLRHSPRALFAEIPLAWLNGPG